jgi:hypothetical protein
MDDFDALLDRLMEDPLIWWAAEYPALAAHLLKIRDDATLRDALKAAGEPGMSESEKAAARLGRNYIDALAWDALGPKLPGCPMELLRLYALLILVKGTETTAEDVHDAWSVWQASMLSEHRSFIPFADLSSDVQGLDEPYVQAIREVALMREAIAGAL